MALMRWDPFAELNVLHDQLNTIFNDRVAQSSLQTTPITDVYTEDDKQVTVEVHLPNFEEKDITVDVHDQALEISAEHQEKSEDKNKRKYMVRESSSSFYRRVALPKQAEEEGIEAHFKHGVLKVTIPLKKLPQPRKVAIGTSNKKAVAKKK